MVASSIPFAVAGGLVPVTVAIVYALGPTTRLDSLALSFLCVGALIYFVILANRLHSTSIDGQSFRAEKDALIAELEQAKVNSDEAQQARGRSQSRQVALSGDHEPRAAHAAQRHFGLFGGDEGRAFRRPCRAFLPGIFGGHSFQRAASVDVDQRNPRSVARRSGAVRTQGRIGRAGQYRRRMPPFARHARQEPGHQRHRVARRRAAAHLGGRARGAPGDAQSSEQRHQIHASGRSGHRHQGGMDAFE